MADSGSRWRLETPMDGAAMPPSSITPVPSADPSSDGLGGGPAILEAEILPDVGDVVGGYRLEKFIARGGAGTVFAARHRRIDRQAAIKLLAPEFVRSNAYLRFVEEARIVNRVKHPNVVQIFDIHESSDPPAVALVMELLEGPTLSQLVRQSALPLRAALNLTLQVAAALESVHALGVVHRDLKPGNIIVVGDPESEFEEVPAVKILDFGIAKTTESAQANLTQTGVILGTPTYMAPEQISGMEVSPAADVYALVEMFIEMLTGQKLFEGTPLKIFSKKLGSVPAYSLPHGVELGDELRVLVNRGLSIQPDDRPSLAKLSDAMRRRLAEPAQPLVPHLDFSPTPAPPRPRAFPWRLALLAIFAVAATYAAVQLLLPEEVRVQVVNRVVDSPVPALLTRYEGRVAASDLSVDALLVSAAELQALDRSEDDVRAEHRLVAALRAAPEDARVIASFVHHRATWRSRRLEPADRAELDGLLAHATLLSPRSEHVARARAAVQAIGGRCAEAAACIVGSDPRRTATLVDGLDGARAARLLAQGRVGAGEYAAAIDELTAIVRGDRTAIRAIRARGVVSGRVGRTVDARKDLSKAITAGEDPHGATLDLAAVELSAGNTKTARRLLHRVAKSPALGAAAEAYVRLASMELSRRRWLDALDNAQAALDRRPASARARALAADAAVGLGELDKARALVGDISSSPRAAAVRLAIAVAEDAAVAIPQHLAALESLAPEAPLVIAWSAVLASSREVRERHIDRLGKLDPAVVQPVADGANTRLFEAVDPEAPGGALLSVLLRHYGGAPDAAQYALRKVPSHPVADALRAHYDLVAKKRRRASKVAKKLLRDHPSVTSARLVLARALAGRRRVSEAIMTYDDALARPPRSPLAIVERATLAWRRTKDLSAIAPAMTLHAAAPQTPGLAPLLHEAQRAQTKTRKRR